MHSQEMPMAPGSADAALLAALAGSDVAAFAELIGRWERPVRSYCHSLLSDEALARAAALATFSTLWDTRATYRPSRDPVLHLFGVARYHSQRLQRRSRWRFGRLGPRPVVSAAPNASAPPPAQATQRLLRLAAQRLPEPVRTPVLLRFGQSMDYATMALLLRTSPDTARARALSGLRALADYLPVEANPWSA